MATPLSWFAMQTTAGQWVGVAREVSKHGVGPGEWPLGVDHPLDLAERRQIGREGVVLGEIRQIVEEAEMPRLVGRA